MPRGYPQGTIFDGVTSFSGGVNSGLSSLLLEPNQLAFAANCTVRGGFVSHRPPYQIITMDFGEDEGLQAAVEEGLFQGAMVYRPDFGNHLIIASLSGRLFQFSISGSTATVTEITVENDPNPPSTGQVWMWQSENYAIINDGQNLPIIFNGTTSRRSFGEQKVLATTAADFTAPPIGDTTQLTLDAPYSGPFNQTVIINDSFYQTVEDVSGGSAVYKVKLKNLGLTTAVIGDGEDVIVDPGRVAFTAQPATSFLFGSPSAFVRLEVLLTIPSVSIPQPLGCLVGGDPYKKIANLVTGQARFGSHVPLTTPGAPPNGKTYPAGTEIRKSGTTDPAFVIGKTDSSFTINSGDELEVFLDTPYSGEDGQVVWIGIHQFEISKVPASSAQPTLNVLNMTDSSGVLVPFPHNILSVPELPAGRMGAYGMGRNWMSLVDGLSFIAGDIVGGDSGSPASNFRDAVLKVTENTFLAEGGVFRLPSSGDFIRAMIFTANMDTSLGQGPLQVFTSRTVFSVNAPVDRTTWQDLENPILTQSLIGSGALAQDATFQVNSDTFFRALDGWRTLILARREFDQQWGNTPITREMERTFVQEDKSLIPFTSGVQFDNRALFSAAPQSTARGIAASAIVALNLDPVSSIRGKLPPVYDGVWTGLNVFKLMRTVIDSTDRSFAFHYNPENQKIDLWELLKTREENRFDNGTDRIEWSFEMASLFVDVPDRPLLRLLDGELQFDDIVGELDVVVQYKPDQYPCWTEWTRFTICAKEESDDEPENKPGFQPRVGLGEPNSADCDEYTGRPFREGHTFQFRIALKGSGRFIGARFAAVPVPDPMFAPPICNGV